MPCVFAMPAEVAGGVAGLTKRARLASPRRFAEMAASPAADGAGSTRKRLGGILQGERGAQDAALFGKGVLAAAFCGRLLCLFAPAPWR